MSTIVNPPGSPVMLSDNSLNQVGTISFPNQIANVELLPPLVQASLTKDGVLNVTAIIYVDEAISYLRSFLVNALLNIGEAGNPQFQFFISANLEAGSPDPRGTTSYIGYQITFEAPQGMLEDTMTMSDILTIETFLWDKDPKTSRGTVTTVVSTSH